MSVEIPSRDNYAWDFTPATDDSHSDRYPDHLIAVDHPNHHAVCRECGYWITVGKSGTEYGHARRNNRNSMSSGGYDDCPHRPNRQVDPQRAQR